MKKKILTWLVFAVFCLSAPAFASEEIDALKEQLKQMAQSMEMLQNKIEAMEKENQEEKEEAKYLSERMDKAEIHTATDRLSLGIEMRTEGHSVHYDDMLVAPPSVTSAMMAQSGNNLTTIQNNLAGAAAIPVDKYDAKNDFLPTTKFNINMKGKVNNNLDFTGRLAAYKAWGDSTGIKVNQGNLGDVTMDGNTSSVPHGDTISLERAYFVYSKNAGDVPVSFSLGRRPSTDGRPLEYGKNSLEGGSPLATIINWQFDGASLNFGLEEATGIPGAAFKLCYGLGFEGDWGNTHSLGNTSADVEDVHMFGVIGTLYETESFSTVFNYAHAWNITDGFTGLTVMPLIVTRDDSTGTYTFSQNTGGYISRMEPYTDIGDWDAASILFRSNFYELMEMDIDFFLALSWSHTDPSRVSRNPFYEIMGQGLLSSNGQLEDHDGYSIYAGVLFPMPFDAKFGLEYNWGSKHWFNFTGAEDSIVGSKLAARGSVYEAYYIQPIISDNFFLKLGGKYYDYKYTGSGNPLGAPVEISEANSLDAFFPVVDTAWDLSASLTVKF